jgi:hypothetical protein
MLSGRLADATPWSPVKHPPMLRASSRSMTEGEETGEPVSATGPKRKAAGRRKGKKRKANGGSPVVPGAGDGIGRVDQP